MDHTQTLMKGIHQITVPTPFNVGPVNMYVVEGDALTLIDAGVKTDEAWQVFLQEMKSLGYRLKDFDQVILTHHHVDHVGLLDFLREETEARVIGHSRNQPWISRDPEFLERHDQFFNRLYQRNGVPEPFIDDVQKMRRRLFNFSCNTSLDSSVAEGDEVDGLPGWKVIETPGHAQSHISLFHEKDGLMIGGDHIIAHISSNALIEPPAEETEDRPRTLIQYRDSLKRCQMMGISRVLSGHGVDVTDVVPLIDTRLQKNEERANLIHQWILEEPMTVFDVCKRLFARVYEQQLALTMSETLGHLDLLESWEKSRIEHKNGIDYYIGL